MKNNTEIDDTMPLGEPHEVTILPDDFLPPPAEFRLKRLLEETQPMDITISLNKHDTSLLLAEASRKDRPYQDIVHDLVTRQLQKQALQQTP